MNRNILFICMLVLGASFISSCNKKLKEDIEAMEKQVADLKDQQNQTNAILGANEPMTATTKFDDNNGDEKIITHVFKFKSSDNSTQGLYDNGDGTYQIYIERFGDVEWNEGSVIRFDYDPETKEISNEFVNHYWEMPGEFNDQAYYYSGQTGATFNIQLNSINIQTGDVSVTATASGNEEFSNTYYYQIPNDGSATTTTLSFSGKLKPFAYNPSAD